MQLLLGDKSELPAKKQSYSSVWFVPELMHIVAMCEEQLPLVQLGEEVNVLISIVGSNVNVNVNIYSSSSQKAPLMRLLSAAAAVMMMMMLSLLVQSYCY